MRELAENVPSLPSQLPRLVRDGLPAALQEAGYACEQRELSGRELTSALRIRLQDEVRDYLARPSIGGLAELVDLLELLARHDGASARDLKNARQDLKARLGAYGSTLLQRADAGDQPSSQATDEDAA